MGRRIDPLTDKHYDAIRLLASLPHRNQEEIAQELSISRRQLYRWRQRSDFDKALRKAIDETVRSRMRRMRVSNIRKTSYDAETLEFMLRSSRILA
ncbi:phBC6A51 family helix-turn-helix protein [Paenibacillus soyae]|uniref:phBC6A51 family helix-turn-helix protein n=1 Tax=Paenibacillus soyae TaxID=2969249 RepID=UPI00352FFC08